MTVDERTQLAVDLKSVSPPEHMPVIRFEVEDYTDSTGDPSLRVLVVLDESADVKLAGGAAIGDFKSALRANLRKRGVTVFPYISFAKPSELADVEEE